LIAQPAREDLVGGRDDRAGGLAIEAPERRVGLRRSLLDEDGRRDEIGRRAQALIWKFSIARAVCTP